MVHPVSLATFGNANSAVAPCSVRVVMRSRSASGVYLVVVVLLMVNHNSAAAESDIALDLSLFAKFVTFGEHLSAVRERPTKSNQQQTTNHQPPTANPSAHIYTQTNHNEVLFSVGVDLSDVNVSNFAPM